MHSLIIFVFFIISIFSTNSYCSTKNYIEYFDIYYSLSESKLNSLDIYVPLETSKNKVMIMIHGGAWTIGDKRNYSEVRNKIPFFIQNDFIFISINYRLSPLVKHPTHIQDVTKAIEWIYKNISEYGGNPDELYLIGHSSGAHLASLLALDENYLSQIDIPNDVIKAVILLDPAALDIKRNIEDYKWGEVYKLIYFNVFGKNPDIWINASPIYHIDDENNSVAFLTFYSDYIKLVEEITVSFHNSLIENGFYSEIYKIHKTHGRLNNDVGKQDEEITELLKNFLDTIPDSL